MRVVGLYDRHAFAAYRKCHNFETEEGNTELVVKGIVDPGRFDTEFC